METKFIEGTNEQYSIREDGVIISHYSLSGNVLTKRNKIIAQRILKNQTHKTFVSTIYINKLKKQVRIESLLFKYFSIQNCRKCNCKFYDLKRSYLCKVCKKENVISNQTKWNNKNIQLVKRYHEKSQKDRRKNISKSYMSSLLKVPVKKLTNDLCNQYKATLLVKRKLAEKLNCSIQKIN
jgi:hypothetical protein